MATVPAAVGQGARSAVVTRSGSRLLSLPAAVGECFRSAGCYKSASGVLQLTGVKRVALAEVARLVAAAEPADALFGRAVSK